MRGAQLEVVYAWHVPHVASPFVPALVLDVESFEQPAAHVLDDALAAEDSSGVRIERTVVCDAAAHALVTRSKDADLVVVGSHGLGRIAASLLGSVSSQVAQHARCPVVIVRSQAA